MYYLGDQPFYYKRPATPEFCPPSAHDAMPMSALDDLLTPVVLANLQQVAWPAQSPRLWPLTRFTTGGPLKQRSSLAKLPSGLACVGILIGSQKPAHLTVEEIVIEDLRPTFRALRTIDPHATYST